MKASVIAVLGMLESDRFWDVGVRSLLGMLGAIGVGMLECDRFLGMLECDRFWDVGE
ncbi:hypothetical protein PN488_15335 [Nodularia spumigena CS-591/12]|uniref:hypothetical protein n=1 Tax=Nodularia spumigena TaxID=70799 RepID=UPI00232A7DB6|nr:hypothetical protein [Nodularia spumigena]MDB9305730.1 hypothetical protein [Nodularia spumigena CS-591/12]MDB9347564.1 hypothetical protein [Nodularia spumigena CS-588/01]MDB9354397.1 hypothetical protein [Nodularia spumigena CS-588/05]